MIKDWLCKCGCLDSEHNHFGYFVGIILCDNHEEYDCCGYTPMTNLEYLEYKEKENKYQ